MPRTKRHHAHASGAKMRMKSISRNTLRQTSKNDLQDQTSYSMTISCHHNQNTNKTKRTHINHNKNTDVARLKMVIGVDSQFI